MMMSCPHTLPVILLSSRVRSLHRACVLVVTFKFPTPHSHLPVPSRPQPRDFGARETLLVYYSREYMLACGSVGGSDDSANSAGIVDGHAYTILQVRPPRGVCCLCVRVRVRVRTKSRSTILYDRKHDRV